MAAASSTLGIGERDAEGKSGEVGGEVDGGGGWGRWIWIRCVV